MGARLGSVTEADFAALREDESAWREEVVERELGDTTLSDGLEN